MPRSVRDIGDIKGKRVLLRLGVNVPVESGHVADTFRLDAVLPTLTFLKERGARVVIVGHIGRDPKESLRPVADYINGITPLGFVPDVYASDLSDMIEHMGEGTAIMLENLRSVPGEKANDPEFAKYLASLADYYVNDAFPASHRAHASIAGVPALIPGYMGLHFEEEIKHLSIALEPPHPFLFILGGAKFETKIPLMEKFLDLADHIFVGGALSNDFYKLKGYGIGVSRADDVKEDLSHMLASPKLIIPKDVRVKNDEGTFERSADSVLAGDNIQDAGPETIKELAELVPQMKFVLWNGPLGDYEEGFGQATEDLLKILADSGVTTVVGGGDTVALVTEMGIADKLTFVSTGGGAMLDYLADGKLPGIDALDRSA